MYPLGKQFEVDNAKARSEEKSIIPGKKFTLLDSNLLSYQHL